MRWFLFLLRLLAGLLIPATAVPAILAVLGFAIPVFDLINHVQLPLFFGTLAGLVLAIALRLRRVALALAALGLAASAWTFMPEYASSLVPRPVPAPGAQVIKLMTHNIFGLNYDMPRVAAEIARENPDIVAVQEFFPEQAQELGDLLAKDYPYSARCRGGKRANLGLFSKIPFEREMSAGDCPASRTAQRTAHILARFTLADGRHFSVMTTHMDWPFPIERQRLEFEAAEAVAKSTTDPLLLVGDFNSTPWSYALKGFAAAAGMTRETRNLVTYPMLFGGDEELMKTVPFLPLDQVFSRGIAVSDLHAGQMTGSDHLPVIVSFSVPN